ncbi:ATP-binding protein [Candidatus Woesearchaeota archaeon]|nr:ATP-binding protein [Candidatus Woesearchaeota archaeon]
MAYEIPQQLQHKEKIIFGLTFSQLAWATLFGTIDLIILTNSNLTLTVKLIIAMFPTVIGIFFIFFDISKWMKNFYNFFRFRDADFMSDKMKRLLDIKKVDNDIIYSHKEIAILQVTPINFSIKTTDEKESIIYGFQRFLNSLDFPIQFVVTTNDLNLDQYLNNLKKRVNNQELFKDFSLFLNNNIQKNQMRNRSFYLVIPKSSDLEIQCNICQERLESVGLKVQRLKNKQILNNLYFFFNSIEDERESEQTVDDGLHYIIAPNKIHVNMDSLEINQKKCRIISSSGFPRMVESGFLDKIISSNDDFDISIHIEPFSIESMMIMLNRELQKQRADLYSEELKKSINPSLEIKYKDTRKVLEELQKGTDKLFNVSLYFNCKGKTQEELDLLTKKVESELNSIMIVPKIPLFRQISGYKAMFPIAKDELGVKRNITTKALSAFFPFTSPFLTLEQGGVMLGLNKNRVPFIKDIFGLSNANGVILATSGSGKSYFTKLLISRQLLNNTKVMVIDPQSEYNGLVEHCNGEQVTISRTSKTIINPLDLMGHDYIEKRLALMDLFKIMFGDLTEVQKAILDKAINQTYSKKGISADSYKKKKPPILKDLYDELERMDKKASSMEKITYRALLNRLYMYTDGVFGFLNRQSSIKFEKDFVCFNIGNMPKQVKPIVMFLILDYVYMKMKESKDRKLLVIDEAWSLLGRAEDASYIFEIVKTCRKFNLGLLLITQDVADLINSKAGHAVLANSSYSFLLRQKPAVIDSVVRTFNLSQMEKEYLLTATQGKGILIMDNEHQELEVVASPKEHEIVTTNPNEQINDATVEDDRKDINIKLDYNKGLFFAKDLTREEKNDLNNNGYLPDKFVPIGKPRQEECWVKMNKVESIDHIFLVQNIKMHLLKDFKDIEIHIVNKPDIIFKTKKGKQYALEIETGHEFGKRKKKILKKFQAVKEDWGKRVFIVLTKKKYKSHYKNLIKDIPILVRTDMTALINKLKNT